jgi:HlyD family secretion protein
VRSFASGTAAKYAGRIAEVRVNEGADVKKDEILVRIDTTEVLAQLAAAKAAVHRAHQGVANAAFAREIVHAATGTQVLRTQLLEGGRLLEKQYGDDGLAQGPACLRPHFVPRS